MNATANTSRRNGKPASCEPCRINKTRCDHGMPKCDRCKQRGIEDRCFYHPAPLTKPRPVPDGTGAGESRPLKRKRPSKPSNTEAVFPGSAVSPGEKLADAVAADVYHPGFLGPGSFAVLLPQDEESSIPQEREISVASERSDRELSHQHPLTKSMRYQMASDVLSVFRHYTAIRELVLWYNSVNEAGVVPAQLQVDAVNAIEALVDKHNLRRAPPSPQLIAQVLESTSRPFTISHSLEARDFHILYSGDNLRFETIGFLLATAGRSLTFGFAPDLFSDQSKMVVNKSQFADELLRGSTTCLFLCTMLATANDITIWMYYENYLFTTMICGYAGPPSWRRIGELSTQIYALGIHKESTSTNIPVWLRETRRRLFCSAYNQDKSISTFLGRPIRISKRYADVSLPLDVSDEEMMQDPSTLQAAIDALDKDGWNTKGRWLRSSWIRLRHTSLRFREEVLEFSLMKIDQSAELQLLDISNRIRSSWDSLPAHMRYWKSCWDEGVPSTVCLMLIIVHLTHWYNEFMIQKLLDYRPLTANTGLLRVSVELLSNVLALGTIRDRSYDVHRDLLHCILLFGVPAASVLATALREQHSTAQSFPHGISRSEIVRMLSVLISHLDAAAHGENGGARQGEANYNLCRKASRIFTKVIDTVLDARNATGSEATPTSENMGVDFNFDMFSGPGLDGFESLEFSGLGPLGLSGAGNSAAGVGNGGVEGSGIDWGQIGQWSL